MSTTQQIQFIQVNSEQLKTVISYTTVNSKKAIVKKIALIFKKNGFSVVFIIFINFHNYSNTKKYTVGCEKYIFFKFLKLILDNRKYILELIINELEVIILKNENILTNAFCFFLNIIDSFPY